MRVCSIKPWKHIEFYRISFQRYQNVPHNGTMNKANICIPLGKLYGIQFHGNHRAPISMGMKFCPTWSHHITLRITSNRTYNMIRICGIRLLQNSIWTMFTEHYKNGDDSTNYDSFCQNATTNMAQHQEDFVWIRFKVCCVFCLFWLESLWCLYVV